MQLVVCEQASADPSLASIVAPPSIVGWPSPIAVAASSPDVAASDTCAASTLASGLAVSNRSKSSEHATPNAALATAPDRAAHDSSLMARWRSQ